MSMNVVVDVIRQAPPSRVYVFLTRQGWWASSNGLWNKDEYRDLEWSEALCIESLDFVEGMKS